MAPHVLHWCTHGQGRWRGHHWQWSRPRLDQYQPMYPCSGCLRGSDGCRRRCRKRPSDTDERPCHSPTVERYACKLHGGTQWDPLSAAVKFANTTLSGWRMAGAFARNGRFSTISHAYVRTTRATRRASYEPPVRRLLTTLVISLIVVRDQWL